MMDDPCLTCGHEHRHHSGLANTVDCDIPGCICFEFEQAGSATASIPTGAVAGPPEPNLCQCGHSIATHPIWHSICFVCGYTKMRDLTREQDQALQATQDQLAAMRVWAAELHDLLQQVWELHGGPEGTAVWVTQPFGQKIGAALQTDPPARGRAILEEVERYRALLEEVVQPQPWGDFADKWTPLRTKIRAALDLGAAQEEGDGG